MSHNLSAATAWFAACAEDNSREFWAANRARYTREVKEPFLALLEADGESADDWRVYRPHNDTRFAKDRGPLKIFIGALRVAPDGTGRYLQLDGTGLLASSGMPYLAPDQLLAWREALDAHGGSFLAAVHAAVNDGTRMKSGYPEPLKRTPKQFDAEHPMNLYLRWKGVEAYGRRTDVGAVPDDWPTQRWAAGAPLRAWLGEYVGASAVERPARGRSARREPLSPATSPVSR